MLSLLGDWPCEPHSRGLHSCRGPGEGLSGACRRCRRRPAGRLWRHALRAAGRAPTAHQHVYCRSHYASSVCDASAVGLSTPPIHLSRHAGPRIVLLSSTFHLHGSPGFTCNTLLQHSTDQPSCNAALAARQAARHAFNSCRWATAGRQSAVSIRVNGWPWRPAWAACRSAARGSRAPRRPCRRRLHATPAGGKHASQRHEVLTRALAAGSFRAP